MLLIGGEMEIDLRNNKVFEIIHIAFEKVDKYVFMMKMIAAKSELLP